MKARELIRNAAYGPETLAVLFQAFDGAWESIAGNFGNDPSAIEAARTKLAGIILGIARDGGSDSVAIKDSALRAMALDYKSWLQ